MEFSGKRFLMIAGSMLGMLVLQSTLFYNLRIFGTRPDLILAVVGSIALLRGWAQGLLWGVLGGLLEDLITGSLPGSHALAKSITGFILGLLEGKVFKENPLLPAVALFVGSLIEGIIFFMAAGAFGHIKWNFITALRRTVWPSAVVTAVFAPVVYRLCEHLYEPPRFGQRGRSL